MPKQVRIRRGTTAQHAAFTGADGELTFDTTKKVLVAHDGVTPGGCPLDGWVKLDPGNTLVTQEIKGPVNLTGGDLETPALCVTYPTFLGDLTANGEAEVKCLTIQQEALAYAATVNLNFRAFGGKRLALAGNVTFTTSNLGFGRELLVRLVADGSARTLAFPAGWKFVGGAAPASLAANKTALLRLWSFNTTDADVLAHYLVES
jgi:hypothetical protein